MNLAASLAEFWKHITAIAWNRFRLVKNGLLINANKVQQIHVQQQRRECSHPNHLFFFIETVWSAWMFDHSFHFYEFDGSLSSSCIVKLAINRVFICGVATPKQSLMSTDSRVLVSAVWPFFYGLKNQTKFNLL